MRGNFLYKRVGSNIRTIRKMRNLTQKELAARSGINRSYLTRIECGRANPSMGHLFNLSVHLEVHIAKILDGV